MMGTLGFEPKSVAVYNRKSVIANKGSFLQLLEATILARLYPSWSDQVVYTMSP